MKLKGMIMTDINYENTDFAKEMAQKICEQIFPLIGENIKSIKGYDEDLSTRISSAILSYIASHLFIISLEPYKSEDQKKILEHMTYQILKNLK